MRPCRHPDLSGADYNELSEMDDVVLECLRGAIWSDHSSLHLLTKHNPRYTRLHAKSD